MKSVLVTGAAGFIGRNLVARLNARDDVDVLACTRDTSATELATMAARADIIYHLAGVNRPRTPQEFHAGNAGYTQQLVSMLLQSRRRPLVVFASSIQADLDNPYGASKRAAEDVLHQWAAQVRAPLLVYRLRNVFGKWSRPDYNSVVATFCHNIARDLPVSISDPGREVTLVYIDDVIDEFLRVVDLPQHSGISLLEGDAIPATTVTLGGLAERLRAFRAMRSTLVVPDFSDSFQKQLYATYLSHVESRDFAYALDMKTDPRGELAEMIKSRCFGQIFVSRTRPGITRGNHYHHTKTEKFLVIAGEGVVRLRRVDDEAVHEFPVSGDEWRVIDIPPGHVHAITNVGSTDMITLFWASELFERERPDTYAAHVSRHDAR